RSPGDRPPSLAFPRVSLGKCASIFEIARPTACRLIPRKASCQRGANDRRFSDGSRNEAEVYAKSRLGIALFALLPEVGAVWGASDDKCLSRPESERPLCRCNLLKRGGWKDVSPDVRLLCEQTFTAKESEPLQSVACGAAGCLYRLNQVDKGGWKFQG